MLMRTSKPVRVTRRGVTLKIHGLELDFYTPELAKPAHAGQGVSAV